MQIKIILAVALEKANLHTQKSFLILSFSITSSRQVSICKRCADANKRFDSAENCIKQHKNIILFIVPICLSIRKK